MKADLSNLFVHLGGGVTETSLPIAAIQSIEYAGSRVKIYLKEDYCPNGYQCRMIDGMSLEDVTDAINKTIISALKELGEDA